VIPITCAAVNGSEEPVILGTQELDQEALDACEHQVEPEQPALRVLVAAVPPQDEEHQEPEDRLEELRWINAEKRVGRRARRRLNAEQHLHVVHGRWRSTLREGDGERPAPGATIIVANGPAAGATHRVAGRDADACDVADPNEIQLLDLDREVASRDRPHEPAPEHEPGPADQITEVVRDEERVIQLAADQRPHHGGENEVRYRRRVMAPPRQLALRDDLRDRERQENGKTESGERKPADLDREGVDYRRVGHLSGVGNGDQRIGTTDPPSPGLASKHTR
jgi:hypothetical protein